MKPVRLAVVALIGLGACKSSDATGVINLSGDLAFAYSGALSGNFNASGQMPLTTTDQRTMDWAVGERDGTDVFVDAAMPRTAGTYDIIFIGINRTTAGTATIGLDAEVTILLGAPVSGTGQPLQLCFFTAGTVVVTNITATRVTGTFSGTGDCVDPNAANTTVTVTNGSFDVPLVADP